MTASRHKPPVAETTRATHRDCSRCWLAGRLRARAPLPRSCSLVQFGRGRPYPFDLRAIHCATISPFQSQFETGVFGRNRTNLGAHTDFSILPIEFLGSASTTTKRFGHLKPASWVRQKSRSSSSWTRMPGRNTTTPMTLPQRGSGCPTTTDWQRWDDRSGHARPRRNRRSRRR